MYGWDNQSFQKVIAHIDADAFFASCEQAVNPALRGKPVVTGKERGIVSAASYEAKKYGIKRGVALWDVKKLCPHAIILPSNYETYSLFSKRMFDIIRQTSGEVEEYSIDEGFIDLTGLRRALRMSYVDMAKKMKKDIETGLGITVSVGLGPSKVLAKLGSGWNKPSGFTVMTHRTLQTFLEQALTQKICGIGFQTSQYLAKYGIKTAQDLTQKSATWVKSFLTKPHQEIWQELQGVSVYPVHTELKNTYASIGKTRTFTPPSKNHAFVFAQLSKNIENAFIKARRHHLAAKKMIVYLKSQDFRFFGNQALLSRPTSYPLDVLPLAEKLFHDLFQTQTLYRATGVVLCDLQTNTHIQRTLFEEPVRLEKLERLYGSIDQLAQKYGKHTVFVGTSFYAQTQSQHHQTRGDIPESQRLRQDQPHARKFLNIPFMTGDVH